MKHINKILVLLCFIACKNASNNKFENLYLEEDYEQCVSAFEDCADPKIITSKELFFVALSYRELSDPCQALNKFYKCIELDPMYPNLQQEIEQTEIIAALSPCSFRDSLDLERFRTSAIFTDSYLEKYEVYKAENKFDTALIAIRYALKTNPTNPYINDMVATTFKTLNMMDSALHYINIAVALQPENCIYISNRAVIESHFGLRAKAEEDFEHALEISDDKCIVLRQFILHLKKSGEQNRFNEIQELESTYGCQ